MPGSTLWGWAGPLLVTLFGAFLRFNRLSLPHAVLFDETYYVPDAYGILRHGVEVNHVSILPSGGWTTYSPLVPSRMCVLPRASSVLTLLT